MTIVDRIKNLSNSKNITIAELERRINIPNGTIRRWNKSVPGIDKVKKVADYFDVSIDYLLSRDEDAEFESFINDPSLQIMMRELAESDEEKRKQLRQMWDIIKKS